jgi:RimK family alpha-L-glutamate ligase
VVAGGVRHALVAGARTPTNVALARAGDWLLLSPAEAVRQLRQGDVAIGRLDVRPTLDGIEEGMEALGELSAQGVTLLNGSSTLLAAHDKLLTARILAGAGVEHPETYLLRPGGRAVLPGWRGPVVVKPRFGSWGRHVERCTTPDELAETLEGIAHETWFASCGAVVQHLVPPCGFDLRIVVARGRVVGAVMRVSPTGEWRTNVALGARRVQVAPPAAAIRVALAAADAVAGDLVGVDLVPLGRGRWVVLEVNGAVEFTRAYAPAGDVFAAAVEAIGGPAAAAAPRIAVGV